MEWSAYDVVEPFGETATRIRFAQMMAALLNKLTSVMQMFTKTRIERVKVEDLLPDDPAVARRAKGAMDPEEIRKKLDAWVARSEANQ